MRFGDLIGQFLGGASAGDGIHVRVFNELRPWFGSLTQAATSKWLPSIASGTLCEIPERRRGHEVGECERFGVSRCVVCARSVCLHHGFVSREGDLICHVCAEDAAQVVPPMQRERARRQEEAPRRTQRERGQERKARQEEQWRQQGPTGGGARQSPPGSGAPPPRPQVLQKDILAAYAILGLQPLPERPPWRDVLSAHRRLSGKWHPDKFVGKTPREKANAEKLYISVQKALDLLKKIYPEAA